MGIISCSLEAAELTEADTKYIVVILSITNQRNNSRKKQEKRYVSEEYKV